MDAVLVHGGAGPMRDGRTERRRTGCRQAAEAGWAALDDGVVQAAVEATVALEDDPVFNAGTGSYLAEDGTVRVDAALVRGSDLAAGAIAHVRGVANPVRVARRIVDEDLPHVLYVGDGAERLADRWDLTVDPETLITDDKRKLWASGRDLDGADTVGTIAVRDGRVAVAQSTGGTPGKALGRIGDAPILGLGLVADDGVGAAMSTGKGEPLMRIRAASTVLAGLEGGDDPDAACEATIGRLAERVGGTGGVLAATPDGEIGLAHNTPHMAWAAVQAGDVRSGVTG